MAGNAWGVALSFKKYPVEGFFRCPEDVAVSTYPFAAFVDIVISWAAMLLTFVSIAVGEFESVPKFTSVAVELMPVLVSSV